MRISEMGNSIWGELAAQSQYGEISPRPNSTPVADIFRPPAVSRNWRFISTHQRLSPNGRNGVPNWRWPISNILGKTTRASLLYFEKTAALANGVLDQRIGAHIRRSFGATALYTQGVAIDATHRRARWESLEPRQYFRRDSNDIERISEVVQLRGLLKCLETMNVARERGSPRRNSSAMADSDLHPSPTGLSRPTVSDMKTSPHVESVMSSLFLPNVRCRDWSSVSEDFGDADTHGAPPSDFRV